jgi:hypothetical protein
MYRPFSNFALNKTKDKPLKVSLELRQYTEPLETSELEFLLRKEGKERRQYYKIFGLLMIGCFIIPFAGAWVQALEGAPHAFSPFRYFVSVGVLLFITGFATYFSFQVNHRQLQLDIKDRTKIVETNRITKKIYVQVKKAYYFYIDSRVKLSIEVSANDYERMKEGDEVSIEYTTHSRQYLGYF